MTMTLEIGDEAPDFTLPSVTSDGETGQVTLSEILQDGPAVLAFFPAAFTGVCTTELCTFRDDLASYRDLDAQVLGVSVDTTFSQKEFSRQQAYPFPLVSDYNKEVVGGYGGYYETLAGHAKLAKRAVFVVGADGRVAYRWVSEEAGKLPPFDEVKATLKALQG